MNSDSGIEEGQELTKIVGGLPTCEDGLVFLNSQML